MTKTEKADLKFREEKKEIIKRLSAMIDAVRIATNQNSLVDLIASKVDGSRDRSANLAAKLAGAVLDYVHSI